MTEQHPITPPPELVEQWYRDSPEDDEQCYIATKAARWGADQEMEACVEWLREARNHGLGYDFGRRLADGLSAARRPKPPSLAEQGLKIFDGSLGLLSDEYPTEVDTIRRALERLQELESKQ